MIMLTMTGRGRAITYSLEQRGSPQRTNPQLQRAYDQSIADRLPLSQHSNLSEVNLAARDDSRISLVKDLYHQGLVLSGADCYNAAAILQHGSRSSDFLLAHDLAILAISMGVERARWLCAASEDRFLVSIEQKQRFATQFEPVNHKLLPVDRDVTDLHRQMMDADTLSVAQSRESRLARG